MLFRSLDGTNVAVHVEEQKPDGGMIVWGQSRNRRLTPEDDHLGFAVWVRKHADTLAKTLGVGTHFGEWWGVGIQRHYELSERRLSLFNTAKWDQLEGASALRAAREVGVAIYSVPVLYTGPWTGNFGFVDGTNEQRPWLTTEQMGGWDEEQKAAADRDAKIDEFISDELGWGKDAALATKKRLQELFPVNPRPRFAPNFILEWLARVGSVAAPGFTRPEGVVMYHKAAGMMFTATIDKDDERKGGR